MRVQLGFANNIIGEPDVFAPYQIKNGYAIAKWLKTFAELLLKKGNDKQILELVKKINPDIRLLCEPGIAFFGDLPIHMLIRSAITGNISLETFKEAITNLANNSVDSPEWHINQKTYSGKDKIGPYDEFGHDKTVLHLIAEYDDFSEWYENMGLIDLITDDLIDLPDGKIDEVDKNIVGHLIEMSKFLISLGADKSFSDGSDYTPYEITGFHTREYREDGSLVKGSEGKDDPLWNPLREILKPD